MTQSVACGILAASSLLCIGATAGAARAADEPPIVLFDMTGLARLDLNDPAACRRLWDETHLVVSLQGLANRPGPRLYLRYVRQPDDFWWSEMTRPGAWLGQRAVERIGRLEDLLARLGEVCQGLVVWDERVPATSNLASTIAGCENLLAVRYDPREGSLYRRLTDPRAGLAVRVRLLADDGGPLFTGKGTIPGTKLFSTGSAKCDAYLWLVERYLKTGKIDPRHMGYYLDGFWLRCAAVAGPENHTLTNHDFFIARRGLLFDLGVWDDEVSVDEPAQKPGTDAATLRAILRAAYDRLGGREMLHVGGFVPWAYKYTDFKTPHWNARGRHAPVPTEWKYAEILSCFNAYMDADALGLCAMANASFFQHYPLQERYAQNAKPTRANLIAQGILDGSGRIVPRRYVAHYVGDYDSAAWLYRELPRLWQDPARGKTPLSWAFNPNLALRFPLGMAWARERRSGNDFFVAGDSGAGYLNPGLLVPPRPHSNLPSGLAVWEQHCRRMYSQWDLSLTGFVIDGFGPGLSREGLDAYARFSPDGVIAQKIGRQGVHGSMPYLRMACDLPDDASEAAGAVLSAANGPAPQFTVVRSILKSPSWYLAVEEELKRRAGPEVRLVDLYTLLWLVREYHSRDGAAPSTGEIGAGKVNASGEEKKP